LLNSTFEHKMALHQREALV